MNDTPLVPERDRAAGDRPTDDAERTVERTDAAERTVERTDDAERTDKRKRGETSDGSGRRGAGAGSGSVVDQRFTRHRVGDTVVLYDRLEQTTWVQADYDPADLV